MAARRQLQDLGHAIQLAAEVDDSGLVEAWQRVAVFKLDQPAGAEVWGGLPCAERPPRAYLLWTRQDGDSKVFELLWAVEGLPEAQWPIVEVSEGGDAQVVAANTVDYIDALLYTGGLVGGGTEEDLENARQDASAEAVRIGDDVAEELDLDDILVEALGERWEAAQDRFGDDWFESVDAGG